MPSGASCSKGEPGEFVFAVCSRPTNVAQVVPLEVLVLEFDDWNWDEIIPIPFGFGFDWWGNQQSAVSSEQTRVRARPLHCLSIALEFIFGQNNQFYWLKSWLDGSGIEASASLVAIVFNQTNWFGPIQRKDDFYDVRISDMLSSFSPTDQPQLGPLKWSQTFTALLKLPVKNTSSSSSR